MKAISLFKLLTVAGFLIFSVSERVYAVETLAQCTTRCNSENPITVGSQDAQYQTQMDRRTACVSNCTAANQQQQDTVAQCRSLQSAYNSDTQKILQECAKIGTSSPQQCMSQLNQCGVTTNPFDETSDNAFASLAGSIAQMQASGASSNQCYNNLLANDTDTKKEAERLDDKIAQLQDKIQGNIDKKSEQNNKLNEKRTKVDADMQKAQEDVDKRKYDRQTKNQEEATRVAKLVLASEKKRRDNITKIADKTNEMANLSYAMQEIQIKFADSEITTQCQTEQQSYMDLKLYKTDSKGQPILDSSGNKIKLNFSASNARTLKNDIQSKYALCMQREALKKSAQIKGINDSKRKLQAEIDSLNAANQDEQKQIELEQKNLEQMKALSDAQDKTDMDNLTKKLDSLNQSVVQYEQYVQQMKASLDQRNANINQQIAQLQQEKLNVGSRYQAVGAVVNGSSASRSQFRSACCNGSRSSMSNSTEFNGSCSAASTQQDAVENSGSFGGGLGTGY